MHLGRHTQSIYPNSGRESYIRIREDGIRFHTKPETPADKTYRISLSISPASRSLLRSIVASAITVENLAINPFNSSASDGAYVKPKKIPDITLMSGITLPETICDSAERTTILIPPFDLICNSICLFGNRGNVLAAVLESQSNGLHTAIGEVELHTGIKNINPDKLHVSLLRAGSNKDPTKCSPGNRKKLIDRLTNTCVGSAISIVSVKINPTIQ